MNHEDQIILAVKLALETSYHGRLEAHNVDSEEVNNTANSVIDIAKSANAISQLYGNLRSERDSKSCLDLLEDFREELRHILYHIGDNNFFSVIIGSTEMDT